MSSVGGAVFSGISKLFSGTLGVTQIGYKGYDLGKTTADCVLTPDQDIKDIMYQQDGTKAADHVRTGIDYVLTATFGEIKTGLLILLMGGISKTNVNPADDDGVIGRSLYSSMRTNESGALKVAAVDSNGVPSASVQDIFNFYEVISIITGDLINWGADTQRNLAIEFRIKWHKFDTGESTLYQGAFGYWGDPSTEDVPAIVWPDVDGPRIVSATAISATELELIFNESLVFAAGAAFAAPDYMVKTYKAVEDIEFLAPSGGVILATKLTLTFAADSFDNAYISEFLYDRRCT